MMESLKLEPGDLVEYHIPPGGFGYPDRVGMLGLVVRMLDTTDLCQVLWAPFAEDGPQWYKINHLRSPRRKRPGSLEDRGGGCE